MTFALASSTNEARERWRARMKDPSVTPPRFEPVAKEKGSKELVLGQWRKVEK